jgi:hypothetical protein
VGHRGAQRDVTVLLDTHVLLYWLGADPRLSAAQAEVIRQAGPADSTIPSAPLKAIRSDIPCPLRGIASAVHDL